MGITWEDLKFWLITTIGVIYLFLFYKLCRRIGYKKRYSALLALAQLIPFSGVIAMGWIVYSDWKHPENKGASFTRRIAATFRKSNSRRKSSCRDASDEETPIGI